MTKKIDDKQKLCFDSTELDAACTQKYIKGNFLPTILCFNEYPDTPSLEKCVERSIDCSEEAAGVTLNIKKCADSNEGQNLMKKARKALPMLRVLSKIRMSLKHFQAPNGFINKKATLFNKAPKEQLCGLKSLKSQEACQPCRRS
ncbi:Protein CBG08447 [Caenorhabditis briggsae]|uniref:Protein CBG08447 n=1 Tax=Caenorhabditis briggsae TaxID=6238 RepID=A8X6K7_CAEBR|nr:Protein CBG08447 [Caenorhabditis briggsae]CAP28268.1 Protein CBG08447 [Caenorhabditis briggsae]